MVKEYHVHGYEEFTKLAESLESSGENVHILFSGGKDETGNRWVEHLKWLWIPVIPPSPGYLYDLSMIIIVFWFSWCPYCVKAEPVIKEALKSAAENSHFIHVEVGDRP